MPTAEESGKLIPPPAVVRVELARAAREARRLRSLLKLSVQSEEDRRFLESLSGKPHAPASRADGREANQ